MVEPNGDFSGCSQKGRKFEMLSKREWSSGNHLQIADDEIVMGSISRSFNILFSLVFPRIYDKEHFEVKTNIKGDLQFQSHGNNREILI